MIENRKRFLYIIFDILAAVGSWTVFLYFGKLYIESINFGLKTNFDIIDIYITGALIFPIFWLIIYFIQGCYHDVLRKSRLQELAQTFSATIIGILFMFFVILLDAKLRLYKDYYMLLGFLLFVHFWLTYLPRIIITSITIIKIRRGSIFFNTLLAGSNGRALEIFNEMNSMPKSHGNRFVGFISIKKPPSQNLKKELNHLGDVDQLEEVIDRYNINEIIIATEKKEYELIGQIISIATRKNVRLNIIPDIYDYLIGRVKLSHLYNVPLIEINQNLIPCWQVHLKRLIDIVFSVLALFFLSPVFLFTAIAIKINSSGKVFYSHERIGRFGKAFNIYKLRSMFQDAEKDGPRLASEKDDRVTSVGRFLRKTRLDEIPQFFNVLKGDMSLVGPRPERLFYINQIVKKASHYHKLQRIRPGITSWGQVKFGYAENVDQMLERLKFDIVYLDNMSLYTDIKILIYTVYIVLKADGR